MTKLHFLVLLFGTNLVSNISTEAKFNAQLSFFYKRIKKILNEAQKLYYVIYHELSINGV